jgi:hypothetical protein
MKKMNDTNWQTLFWSLMGELEKIDNEVIVNLWEEYEVAGMELEDE